MFAPTSSAQDQNVLKLTTDHPVYAVGKRIVVRARVGQNGLKLDGLARFDAGNPFAVVKARGRVALEQTLKSRVPNGAIRADLEYVVKP